MAVDCITEFLTEHDMLVYLVVFDKSSFQISEKLFTDIAAFIDDKYVDTHFIFRRTQRDAWDESTVLGTTQILPPNESDQAALSPDAFHEEATTASKKISLPTQTPTISL